MFLLDSGATKAYLPLACKRKQISVTEGKMQKPFLNFKNNTLHVKEWLV